jgi:hypothetical protein
MTVENFGGYPSNALDSVTGIPGDAYFQEGAYIGNALVDEVNRVPVDMPLLTLKAGGCDATCKGGYFDDTGFHPLPCVKTSKACAARYRDIAPSFVRQNPAMSIAELVAFFRRCFPASIGASYIGRPLDSDPNAEMIRRDGAAEPKLLMIEAPMLRDEPSSAPGLMVVAGLGQRWG